MNKNKINAIIMAAGKGERLRPLTLTTPKPLININGQPMIENIIESLLLIGIKEIVVVTGYLKDQFEYLKDKYGVTIVNNPDYDKANNISSLYYARDYLGNSVILDGDQIINNINIINLAYKHSGYICSKIDSFTKEWILKLDENNRIIKCYRDGFDKGYELKSISFWKEEEAYKLKRYLKEDYIEKRITDIYWDDIAMFLHKNDFELYGYVVEPNSVIEIDNLDELKRYGGELR